LLWGRSAEEIVLVAAAALVGVALLWCIERALSSDQGAVPAPR
jgi:hypothetical protein